MFKVFAYHINRIYWKCFPLALRHAVRVTNLLFVAHQNSVDEIKATTS